MSINIVADYSVEISAHDANCNCYVIYDQLTNAYGHGDTLIDAFEDYLLAVQDMIEFLAEAATTSPETAAILQRINQYIVIEG